MLERDLTNEFRRVAEATPVPADLFPAGRLKTRPRDFWPLVAVAAAAAVMLGLTPMGQQAVSAATSWVTKYSVKIGPEDLPVARVRSATDMDVPVGEVLEFPGEAGLPREVLRGMTVADLLNEDSTWPLPSYLGPTPDTKVILTEIYTADATTAADRGIYLTWRAALGGQERSLVYNILRSKTGISADVLADLGNGKRPAVRVDGVDPAKVRQQTVTVKGMEVTATLVENRWSLHWWHTGGSVHLSGNIPLEELVKVAESLPSLQ